VPLGRRTSEDKDGWTETVVTYDRQLHDDAHDASLPSSSNRSLAALIHKGPPQIVEQDQACTTPGMSASTIQRYKRCRRYTDEATGRPNSG
jgi:hypothetical protein